MNKFFNISDEVLDLDKRAMVKCGPVFDKIDDITFYNQQKVLSAFIENGVSEACFSGSTGYGYGDKGREVLEAVFAQCVGAEDAIIRHNFVSGTHTLTVGLFGILRPGDKMLCVTGRPYDTLIGVLGIDEPVNGSLKDFGIEYDQVDLKEDGQVDLEAIAEKLKNENYKMCYIQRSRGYSLRPSLTVERIGEIVRVIRKYDKDSVIFVDNCYGEFVEKDEPLSVGADLIAGSLIKNPGGGIAPTGGYIAGRKDLVEMCAFRLTAPGVGKEIGATLGQSRELFMGLYSSPHVVGQALKTAVYTACIYEMLGYKVTPKYDEDRGDIIEALLLEKAENLCRFCEGIQSGAPVDSFVTPEPWDMPGYDSQVIMAAGTFTGGGSLELSADAPLREPFAVWMQGSLNFDGGRTGIMLATDRLLKSKQSGLA